jgi:DNA-binding CsgD family transcriptional regulator
LALTDERVEQIVQSFACAALDPAKWLLAMTSMSDAIGAVCCALELADLNTGATVMKNSVEMDGSLLKEYEERIFQINPRVAKAMPLPVGSISDDRYLMDMDDPRTPEFLDWLERTPYYFLRGGKILADSGHIGFFTANYAKSGGLPAEGRDDVFPLLIPQLINFVQIGRSLNGKMLRNPFVSQDPFEQDRPFALMDRAGRLIECSPSFEAIMRSSQMLALRAGRLVALHARHRDKVEMFLRSALGPRRLLEPPMPVRLNMPESPRGLVLRAVPLEPCDDVFDIFRPEVLVTLTDLDQPCRVRRRELAALFGLTERESDVASLVSEGYSIETAAHTLGISENTVRFHLKSVFGKLGVSRQAELAALVSRIC